MNKEEYNKAEDARVEDLIEQRRGVSDLLGQLEPVDPVVQDFYFNLINDRKVGEYRIPTFPTIDTAALIASLSSREQQVLLIHEALHRQARRNALEREFQEESLLYYAIDEMDFYKIDHGFVVEPKQKPKPTWQDRRQQSQKAKQALVAKMKGARK